MGLHWTVWAFVVFSILNLVGYIGTKDEQVERRSAFMAIFFLVVACFLVLLHLVKIA